jgi:glycosyltransferase involved in cell wall biosynthesis
MKGRTLTIAILAKNEEEMIGRAIASALFADEVLVIDGGSEDRTVEISELAGGRVIERPFDDFARQRNYALEAARGEWVLFLDADERIGKELASEIRKLLKRHPDADAYAVPRKNMALGRWLEWHLGGAADMPVRLMRRGGPRWSGQVHEVVEGANHIGALSAPLWHLTHRSVSEVVRKIDYYSDFQADERIQKGAQSPGVKQLLASFERTLGELWRSGLKKEGDVGAVEAVLLAFNETLVQAKIWEKLRHETLDESYKRADAELELPTPEADIIRLPDTGA